MSGTCMMENSYLSLKSTEGNYTRTIQYNIPHVIM